MFQNMPEWIKYTQWQWSRFGLDLKLETLVISKQMTLRFCFIAGCQKNLKQNFITSNRSCTTNGSTVVPTSRLSRWCFWSHYRYSMDMFSLCKGICNSRPIHVSHFVWLTHIPVFQSHKRWVSQHNFHPVVQHPVAHKRQHRHQEGLQEPSRKEGMTPPWRIKIGFLVSGFGKRIWRCLEKTLRPERIFLERVFVVIKKAPVKDVGSTS